MILKQFKREEEDLKGLEIIIEDGFLKDCLVYHEAVKQFHKESYIRLLESVLKELPEEKSLPYDYYEQEESFNDCLSQTKSIILKAINEIKNNQ